MAARSLFPRTQVVFFRSGNKSLPEHLVFNRLGKMEHQQEMYVSKNGSLDYTHKSWNVNLYGDSGEYELLPLILKLSQANLSARDALLTRTRDVEC